MGEVEREAPKLFAVMSGGTGGSTKTMLSLKWCTWPQRGVVSRHHLQEGQWHSRASSMMTLVQNQGRISPDQNLPHQCKCIQNMWFCGQGHLKTTPPRRKNGT
ncbi:hypothetical protein SETIT_2G036500v2 [Setaria italica]|uniref:Uncharacterized protein n=2 Tax=Setaria TaxID=4554 RepID=A0A368PVG9_SETIT|nr:hypothetical protein SETIT_2G036500v2 [Setaria italica]TKW30490.1 hypothetical protein SEVIR_2G041300v2 [Setaria viridis]